MLAPRANRVPCELHGLRWLEPLPVTGCGAVAGRDCSCCLLPTRCVHWQMARCYWSIRARCRGRHLAVGRGQDHGLVLGLSRAAAAAARRRAHRRHRTTHPAAITPRLALGAHPARRAQPTRATARLTQPQSQPSENGIRGGRGDHRRPRQHPSGPAEPRDQCHSRRFGPACHVPRHTRFRRAEASGGPGSVRRKSARSPRNVRMCSTSANGSKR